MATTVRAGILVRRPLTIAAILILGSFLGTPAAAQQADRRLFDDAAPPATSDQRAAFAATAAQYATAVRYVRVNMDAFGSLDTSVAGSTTPARLRLDLFDGTSLVALFNGSEQIASGRRSYVGRIENVELSDVILIVEPAAGSVSGTISLPGGLYQLLPAGDGVHALLKLGPLGDRGDVTVEPPVPPADGLANTSNQAASNDNGSRIDVMIVYTPAARAAAGGTAAIESLIDLAITETNQGYANSGVTPRLRLVYKGEVSYAESGDFGTDLNRLQATSDGYLDNVHDLRNQYGADMVGMIIEGTQYCGMGFLGGLSSSYAPYAFQVTARTCATGYYSLGHEFGHIQGARHDWLVDPTNLSPYTYNHGYYPPSLAWRTIMAYADGCLGCPRILYWSNPSLLRNGEAMGAAEGAFHAADNRKTLNNTAATVANFRAEVTPSVPPAATLVSPSGSISTLTPAYTWNNVASATWYYLKVQDSLGNIPILTWYQTAAVCGASSCSTTPTTALVSGRTYTWSIQTWNAGGYGPWSSGLGLAPLTVAVPPAATLVSPSGSLSTLTPTYTWNNVASATWYYLKVQDSLGNIPILTWYQTAAVCGASSCSITPTTALVSGRTYTWSIQTWNAGGYGPWSTGVNFAPFVAVPPAATLVSPSGSISTLTPAYTWNNVASATWYYLKVQDSLGNIPILTWYQTAAVCGASSCSVTPPTAVVSGRTYTWSIQTWNAGGYGPWSSGTTFAHVSPPVPPAATLASPSGNVSTLTPAYTWNNVASATWYYLKVQDSLGNIAILTWYQTAAVCGASSCSVTPPIALVSGRTYAWSIQTWNAGGYGPWSSGLNFAPSVPPTATLVSPSGSISTSTPTYTWNNVASATWYYLWVQDSLGNIRAQTWYQTSAVCGASSCSITPPTALVSGRTYSWWIQTWNAVGYGAWSAPMTLSK